MKKIVTFSLLWTMFLAFSAFADQRQVISKCSFDDRDEKNRIQVGSPYLYIFGVRHVSKDGQTVSIEQFEVQHDLATVADDMSNFSVPNLDESKIYKADFPIVSSQLDYFGIYWRHPAIEGRSESVIPGVIDYRPDTHSLSQTNGTFSALAYAQGRHPPFRGAYPACKVIGLKPLK